MASLDSLPPDQRAVLQLVLQRGRSYDEIAKMLSIDRAAVRERALGAFDALGPSTRVPPERRALITDYLLRQLPDGAATDTHRGLAGSANERAWARVVASELGTLAAGPLPEIPTDGGAAPVAADTSAAETAPAEAETAEPAEASPTSEATGAPDTPTAEPVAAGPAKPAEATEPAAAGAAAAGPLPPGPLLPGRTAPRPPRPLPQARPRPPGAGASAAVAATAARTRAGVRSHGATGRSCWAAASP